MCWMDEEENYVMIYFFLDIVIYGWVVVLQFEQGLILGYIWCFLEYFWINIWNYYVDG